MLISVNIANNKRRMGLFLHHVESFLPGDLYARSFFFFFSYGMCCHLVVISGTASAKYKYLTSVPLCQAN